MNARANDLVEENNSESDSDTNSDAVPEYYQPLVDGDDDDDSDEYHHRQHQQPHAMENGISSLQLNGDVVEEEEEEEEERAREASDLAILRAFRDDDNRRSAPLSPENSRRVLDAMRAISFSGSVPDWAGRVPEDLWIHQLRQRMSSSSGDSSLQN